MDPTAKPRTTVASSLPSISSSSSSSSPATPARTAPLPEDQLAGWNGGPDPITWIREYDAPEEWELPRGTQREWELPRDKKLLTLGGSRSCDITIPDRGLSSTHCLLERRADKIRLHDQQSTNGTFVRDYKITNADLIPGDTFTPAPITLIAMNDVMVVHRPTLVEIVGIRSTPSPDWLMMQAASSRGHLLITGEPGCDQERLARAIHAMSLRRAQQIMELATIPTDRAEQIAIVKQASRTKTTVVLAITAGKAAFDPEFASMLHSASYGVRAIVLAPTPEVARRAITEPVVSQMQHVPLRRLADRTGEIDQLLDRILAERQAAQRTADLTRANQAALRAYDWPGNLAELRQIAEGIAAHAALGGLRPAGKALGRPYQTLQKHFARVGLVFPLFS